MILAEPASHFNRYPAAGKIRQEMSRIVLAVLAFAGYFRIRSLGVGCHKRQVLDDDEARYGI